MVDRVQITRRDDSIPRWQIRDLKVSTSQLRYAPRASEEQIQEAVKLKPVTRSSDKGHAAKRTPSRTARCKTLRFSSWGTFASV